VEETLPLYSYKCESCGYEFDAVNKIADRNYQTCSRCESLCEIQITGFFNKRSDAKWIQSVNGFLNDPEFVAQGRQRHIETREQYRNHIETVYSDPDPRVKALKEEYLDRS
jgi:putative FmdB family regulatory protein